MSAAGSLVGRLGRVERISLAIALVWGIGLIIAALALPAYQSSGASSSGASAVGSATLVAVNGWHALIVAAAPLTAAVLTGSALLRRAGREGAGVLAWIVVGLLIGFTVLGMLSVGVFVLPATIALVVACINHGLPPRGVVARPGAASRS
jgi:hypothetical protein